MVLAALHICITTSGSCTSTNPLLTTLLPAVIGALLGVGGSLLLRRGDREWQRSRDRFVREMQIVKPLDDALVEAQRHISATRGAEGGGPDWHLAHHEWESGWVRLTPHLTDAGLEDRYAAVGTVLKELMLSDDVDAPARDQR